MDHVAPYRVTLKILDDRELLLSLDVERDQNVQPRVSIEGEAQIGPRDAN